MIKGVIGQGHIRVDSPITSFPSGSMHDTFSGMMRYNLNYQCLEIYTGSSWQMVNTAFPTVTLNEPANRAMTWAIKKMEDEEYILGLSKEYPAVKALLDQMNDTKLKIDMVVALVKAEVKE